MCGSGGGALGKHSWLDDASMAGMEHRQPDLFARYGAPVALSRSVFAGQSSRHRCHRTRSGGAGPGVASSGFWVRLGVAGQSQHHGESPGNNAGAAEVGAGGTFGPEGRELHDGIRALRDRLRPSVGVEVGRRVAGVGGVDP